MEKTGRKSVCEAGGATERGEEDTKRQRRGRQRAFQWPGDLITADICMVMPANYPKHLSSSLCCDQMSSLIKGSERWE